MQCSSCAMLTPHPGFGKSSSHHFRQERPERALRECSWHPPEEQDNCRTLQWAFQNHLHLSGFLPVLSAAVLLLTPVTALIRPVLKVLSDAWDVHTQLVMQVKNENCSCRHQQWQLQTTWPQIWAPCSLKHHKMDSEWCHALCESPKQPTWSWSGSIELPP